MKNIFQLLFFLSISCVCTMSAQNSAQVGDFVDLGNRAVSKYTGRVEKEIPICSINEFGFNINVGLHYSSQGFKPSKRESEVGHNWFLNVGGAINRIVNGVDDELQDDRHATDGYNGGKQFNVDGYYTGIKKHSPTKGQITSRSILDTIERNYYVGPIEDTYELNPDEFQFNFGGVSGSFYIDLDGSVKIVPNGPYNLKVDISNFSTQRAEPEFFDERKPVDSQIIITLDNGYKYYFGGNYNYLQWYWDIESSTFSFDENLNNIRRPDVRPIINTWNLAKIVAPNGYEVVYTYNNYDYNYKYYDIGLDQPQKNDESIVIGQTRDGISRYFRFPRYNRTSCQFITPSKQIAIFKKSNLKSIRVNNTIDIDFAYSNIIDPATDRPGHLLDSIKVSGQGVPNKEVKLEYTFYNKRPFLESVQTNNQEPYRFEYQHTDNLPGYNTLQVDQNGYYNIGRYSKLNNFGFGYKYNSQYGVQTGPGGRPLPGPEHLNRTCFFRYNSNNEIVTTNGNLPGQFLADRGLLKKITLPSKGSLEFVYDTKWYKPWISGAEPIRVSKVLYNNGAGNVTTRSYKERGNGTHRSDLYYLLSTDRQKKHTIVEEKMPNGSSMYSLYSRIDQNYINSGLGTFDIDATPFNTFEYNPPAFDITANSTIHEKLIAEFSFDSEGKPLSKTEYFYNIESDEANNIYSDYIPGIMTIKDWGRGYNIYLKPIFLTKKRSYTYDKNTIKRYGESTQEVSLDTADVKLQGVENYLYDSTFHKLKEQVSYTEERLKQKTIYTYPFDYDQSNTVINTMINNNILPSITEKNILENNGVDYAQGISVSEFKIHNGFIAPFKNYQWTPNPNNQSLTPSGTQLYVDALGQTQITEPRHTTIITYDNYSDKGIPYEATANTGESTYTQYTNSDRKPFLGIKNITYEELITIPASPSGDGSNVLASIKNLEGNVLQVEEVSYLINQLRQQYPKARCSYTNYFTDTGLINFVMDSRKQKIFYEYDENYRLITTRDNDGNIINYTSYNTKK